MSKEIVPIPRHGLNWATTIVMIIFHIGAIAAIPFFSWKILAATIFLYWMSTGLGISLGITGCIRIVLISSLGRSSTSSPYAAL